MESSRLTWTTWSPESPLVPPAGRPPSRPWPTPDSEKSALLWIRGRPAFGLSRSGPGVRRRDMLALLPVLWVPGGGPPTGTQHVALGDPSPSHGTTGPSPAEATQGADRRTKKIPEALDVGYASCKSGRYAPRKSRCSAKGGTMATTFAQTLRDETLRLEVGAPAVSDLAVENLDLSTASLTRAVRRSVIERRA